MIKELRASSTMAMTTGSNVQHVTDEKGRFKNKANWGDGWGWALYYADDPSRNVSTDYKKDCLGCHIPAKKTDYIYTYGYPLLR